MFLIHSTLSPSSFASSDATIRDGQARMFNGLSHVLTRYFEFAARHLQHPLLIVDEIGLIVAANSAAETLFAYPAGDLVGRRFESLFTGSSRTAHQDLCNAGILTGCDRDRSGERHLEACRRDGVTLPVEVKFNGSVRGCARYLVVSVIDMAECRDRRVHLATMTRRQLRVQRLVGALAARFLEAGASRVDDVISEGLRRIGLTLQLDRVVLWRNDARKGTLAAAHQWMNDG